MTIKSLKLENFRGLINETIEFDPSMTVFAGLNGGGKSTALEAIAIMLSWLPVKISTVAGAGKKIKEDDITFGKDHSRLEMIMRMDNGKDVTLVLSKKRSGSRNVGEMDDAGRFGDDMRVMLDSQEGQKVELPVFAYYGADRTTIGFASPFPTAERTSVYHRAFEAGTDIAGFAKWFAEMLTERETELAKARELPLKKANKMRTEIDRKFGYLFVIRNALAQFSPEFKNFSVRDGRLFVDEKHIPAYLLSQGEKSVLALIADIALRMIVANPSKRNQLETEAIVLVDEIDSHLHPEWQATVAERIVNIFPNTQFIISTHSPTVLSLCKNAYKLNCDESEKRFEKVENQYGRNPADILSTVMNAHREKNTAAKFKTLYDYIDKGKFESATRIIDELSKELPEDPELLRAEYMLRAYSARRKS